MVELRIQPESLERELTLRRNCSLSWNQMSRVLAVLLLCLAAVTAYFVAKGAWLVLPFTGLEAIVLIFGIYLSARAGATREVVRIGEHQITIAEGRRTLQTKATFGRGWAQVMLWKDSRGWYPSRLYLGSHGRFFEVGTALVESERLALAADLERLILHREDTHETLIPTYAPALETAGQQI